MRNKPLIPVNKDPALTGFGQLTPEQTAAYTRDMLESLLRLAQKQGQPMLAHLLQIAALEADSLVRPQR